MMLEGTNQKQEVCVSLHLPLGISKQCALQGGLEREDLHVDVRQFKIQGIQSPQRFPKGRDGSGVILKLSTSDTLALCITHSVFILGVREWVGYGAEQICRWLPVTCSTVARLLCLCAGDTGRRASECPASFFKELATL